MIEKRLTILVLDDEDGIREELTDFFELNDYIVKPASKPSEAFRILLEETIDIAVLDIQLPEMDGLEVLQKIKQNYPEIEVIMITGHGDTDSVIKALRLGAFDFFKKPFRTLEIKNSIERTQKFIELNQKLEIAEQTAQLISRELEKECGTTFIGKSREIRDATELVKKVAAYDETSVLITGESGTGKELIARSIHLLSNRKNKFFYAVNCSAVPENLFESEFFGHTKGAFTGAAENKAGWFEIANHGTLFLDEIGDMPITQQIKLLRVLEEKSIRRIGSHREIPVNVRIISASNKNIEKLASENQFRLDLFHRLNSFSIHIPPLRKRREDIHPLIDYFAIRFAVKMRKQLDSIHPEVYELLSAYPFYGNVRELKNLIERAVILAEDGVIQAKHFVINHHAKPVEIVQNKAHEENLDLEENEKRLILKALEKAKNNKTKAAELLNISWFALNRKMKKFEVE
jgi:DNA-binding NtrC family response regulator